MRLVRFCLIFAFIPSLWSQYDIRWSELMPSKGRILDLYPLSYSDFYTTRLQGSALMSSLYLSKHSNFAVTTRGKIKPKLENGYGMIEEVKIINGSPIVFISDKKEGNNTLYYQKYDNTCMPVGLPVKISSYQMPKGWKRKGSFYVHLSENKEFVCVDYEIPGSKSERDRFGYKVFSNGFDLVSEGEYELPYESDLVQISNNYLSNTGDYFLVAKIFQRNESKKIFRSINDLQKMVLMQVTPSGVEEFDLELQDGKRISDMTMSSDNNRIMTFTGLYGSGTGINGVFFYQLDFNKKEVISQGWNEFGKNFITQDWTDREREKAEKRAAKGKGEPEFYNYDVRKMITLTDGSIIGMLEQYFVREVQNYNAQTRTYTTTYYYYYNDVIIYKIMEDGTFGWMKKIPKYQVSTNDGGFFSSIASFLSGDKLCVLFNDNSRNYNESGYFMDDAKKMYAASYRKKSNVVALVEFDLNTGEYTRKTFFERKEVKAYAVPKKFAVDYNKKEMLMILIYGRKEKYGVLSL